MSCHHRSSGLLRIILLIIFIAIFWRQILFGLAVYLFVILLTMIIKWTMIHPWFALLIVLSLIPIWRVLPVKLIWREFKSYWQSFKAKLGY
jgi:O-antigen ligase